jgi:2-C-methyl-D-erythritol 4-phosphate cytidylyltransferase/2-C-methyl-D-erythritol 2,4-cyclodiphosphate synthase
MHVTAIIAAGGRGLRLGRAHPKQLIEVAGEPILSRSVRAFVTHPSVSEVIVALPLDLCSDPPPYLRDGRVRIVAGGARRQDSVANAFHASSQVSDIIVIHDAARPFASADLIARTIAAAVESGAAVAAVMSRDTVKRSTGTSGGTPVVQETLPRDTVFLAQTPQAFRRQILADALANSGDATDEAALAERAGHQVRIVEGESTNIKITTEDDLAIAQVIALERQGTSRTKRARTGRAGTGYDLHRLIEGRPLILGGVTIPSTRGAQGHSDADVVCHAITDAVLGALSLGDIGRHFPDSDPQWKDASSVDLLKRAVAMVTDHGYEIGNVDVTVVLEQPKIKNYVDPMRQQLARALGIDPERVSVKGKTNEGMDAIGRGEAIAAHAVALLRARD